MTQVSALYVRADGPYPSLVADWWDEQRDARLYAGPNPVVAHPPCSAWCRLAPVNEARYGHRVGDDGGCFAAALDAVRRWGGVLEHPAGSYAWARHGLPVPPAEGWAPEFLATRGLALGPDHHSGGWVCEVAQSAYGHRARKLTWLYYVGLTPRSLDWRKPAGTAYVSWLSNHGGRPNMPRLSKAEASRTPLLFAEALVALAAGARP